MYCVVDDLYCRLLFARKSWYLTTSSFLTLGWPLFSGMVKEVVRTKGSRSVYWMENDKFCELHMTFQKQQLLGVHNCSSSLTWHLTVCLKYAGTPRCNVLFFLPFLQLFISIHLSNSISTNSLLEEHSVLMANKQQQTYLILYCCRPRNISILWKPSEARAQPR